MKLAYPVCFYKEDEGYSAIVPDFSEASTQGDDLSEAIYMAEDLIAGLILSNIKDEEDFPLPSSPVNIVLDEHDQEAFVSLVLVDLDKKEKEFAEQNKLVKKTLTIPKWVNDRAAHAKINFSQTLTDALIKKL